MATHLGSEGTVKVGSDVIAEIRSFSLERNADTVEDTTMGDADRTYKTSLKGYTATVDVFWDPSDSAGQGALTQGAEVTFSVYPEGDTSGDTYYTGTALVTGFSTSGTVDGLVEASISLQGTGALTTTTVA